jgi:2'-5' RNA ligase
MKRSTWDQDSSAVATMKRIRAFIALKLPESVSGAIRNVQEQLVGHRLNVRWVKAENIHLTLKYLGDIDAARVDDVAAALEGAAVHTRPFYLSAKGGGVFPNVKRARVIWVGVAGQVTALVALQEAVETELAAIGFPSSGRRFTGHLTLGRSKGAIDAGRLLAAMDDMRRFESEPFIAERIIIFRSELQPTGAVYTELRKVVLRPHQG